MTVVTDFKTSIHELLSLLGSDFSLTDDTGTAKSIRAAFVDTGTDDKELVNALGIEARTIYCENVKPAPMKFWTLTSPTGITYTIHAVREEIIDNVLIAYKLMVKE